MFPVWAYKILVPVSVEPSDFQLHTVAVQRSACSSIEPMNNSDRHTDSSQYFTNGFHLYINAKKSYINTMLAQRSTLSVRFNPENIDSQTHRDSLPVLNVRACFSRFCPTEPHGAGSRHRVRPEIHCRRTPSVLAAQGASQCVRSMVTSQWHRVARCSSAQYKAGGQVQPINNAFAFIFPREPLMQTHDNSQRKSQ